MIGTANIVKTSVSLALVAGIFTFGSPAREVFAQNAGPLVLPGAVGRSPEPAQEAPRRTPSPATPESGAARPATPPAAAAPPPLPDNIFGLQLHLNGRPAERSGRVTVSGFQQGLAGLHLQAFGRAISDPTAQCYLDLGGDAPAPMLRIEDPYGRARFRLQSPVCPLVVELLPHSVRISIPDGECVFAQADCRLDPAGVWGPESGQLAGQVPSIERRRGRAEREMADASRKLLRRLSGAEQRDAAAEQAAFSSERTMVCRNYADEEKHGFCAAELTAARAEYLNRRFELTPQRPRRN